MTKAKATGQVLHLVCRFTYADSAYIGKDGRAELTWVSGYSAQIVYRPADGHPPKYIGLGLCINRVRCIVPSQTATTA